MTSRHSQGQTTTVDPMYDYIVIGSGPGGGPLACNLARQGHSVLLLEAGDDQGLNLLEKIPVFFANWEEDAAQRWDFFVDHYSDAEQAAKDPKMTWETPDGTIYVGLEPPAGSKQLGIYYPRSGTLGGCTAHNAMVAVLPPASEWDHIAKVTGDKTWSFDHIQPLWERLERCAYLPPGTPGHGFKGYLETNVPDESTVTPAQPVITEAVKIQGPSNAKLRDINDLSKPRGTGVYHSCLNMTRDGRRSFARNYIVATALARDAKGNKKYNLTVSTNSLATRIMFDHGKRRRGRHAKTMPNATAVEFLGKSLYKADPRFNAKQPGIKRVAHASKEIIVAGGAFNTPQLLKLSGIGPREELEAIGLDVVVDLPGVGWNLQDNYEYSVNTVSEISYSGLLKSNGLLAGDPLLKQWVEGGGPYATNGLPGVMLHRTSTAQAPDPDLMIFFGAVKYDGYYPGYSKAIAANPKSWTWDVLANTPSLSGTVKLRSTDPQDVPAIAFHFFTHGRNDADLTAMSEGVQLCRKINAAVGAMTESQPGPGVDTKADIKQSIKDAAFGHHASSSCAMGPDDDVMACLDGKLRVRGVEGLRVCDASAFPRVPWAFPTLAIYIMSEKATDMILGRWTDPGSEDLVLDGEREFLVLEEDHLGNAIVHEQDQGHGHGHDLRPKRTREETD